MSSRDSVIDNESWKLISPSGASSHFKDHFENKTNYVRNKVLKYGAEVALNQGDLAIGYIVNIGKAGCFV